ncbi:pin1 [Scenedesmus sp. PABB004]|nr:pin1 [Scenedesmus sp. PABB004]
MPTFHAPDWVSQPCRTATLEVQEPDGSTHTQPVDKQAYYLFGRDASACDVPLDHPSASRCHAVLCHHTDGRLFIIDLGSTHGTFLDGAALPPNKPTVLKNGAAIRFGALDTAFVMRDVESAAEKRRGEPSGETAAKRSGGGAERSGTVRASHLLVKHRDSRRPSSWKEKVITRSKEEALEMIQAFRARLEAGEVEFGALAAAESHCSSARKGGDLGEFGPGQMQRAFEDATYALAVGELSQPVFSDSGVHLILRTG